MIRLRELMGDDRINNILNEAERCKVAEFHKLTIPQFEDLMNSDFEKSFTNKEWGDNTVYGAGNLYLKDLEYEFSLFYKK